MSYHHLLEDDADDSAYMPHEKETTTMTDFPVEGAEQNDDAEKTEDTSTAEESTEQPADKPAND